jgi:hypothetical protein
MSFFWLWVPRNYYLLLSLRLTDSSIPSFWCAHHGFDLWTSGRGKQAIANSAEEAIQWVLGIAAMIMSRKLISRVRLCLSQLSKRLPWWAWQCVSRAWPDTPGQSSMASQHPVGLRVTLSLRINVSPKPVFFSSITEKYLNTNLTLIIYARASSSR